MSRTLGFQLSPETASSKSSKAGPGYVDDYAAWAHGQAEALRQRRISDLDFLDLAEELDDLGRSVKREVGFRLQVLLTHLLKWRFQPSARSTSWKGTIVEQRNEINDLLLESPSVKAFPATVLDRQHQSARLKASGETELPEAVFPQTCPFAVEQTLDPTFYPEAEG